MKKSTTVIVIVALFLSCSKERLPVGLHFQMEVNGKKTLIEACGSSAYVAENLKDTATSIRISCGSGAGFYLKGKIVDSTYKLGDKNIASYSPMDNSGYKSYSTTAMNTGTLTITRITYKNQPALKGSFAYNAVERNTSEVISVSKGTFLLRIYGL